MDILSFLVPDILATGIAGPAARNSLPCYSIYIIYFKEVAEDSFVFGIIHALSVLSAIFQVDRG